MTCTFISNLSRDFMSQKNVFGYNSDTRKENLVFEIVLILRAITMTCALTSLFRFDVNEKGKILKVAILGYIFFLNLHFWNINISVVNLP